MLQNEFFPTPKEVIDEMLEPYDLRGKKCLDPSAGAGAILDAIHDRASHRYGNSKNLLYAIELDPDLRYTLQGKDYTVISSDFLAYDEPTRFDLIAMNPPFSEGVKHVLKAWDILNDDGDLVALLNAESVKNLCNKERELLADLVEKHGDVEFLGQCFKNAERPTNVEVAMIRLCKPPVKRFDFDMGQFNFHETISDEEFQSNPLASANFLESLVGQYKGAERALIERYENSKKLNFFLQGVQTDKYSSLPDSINVLKFSLDDQISSLKSIFWELVFRKSKIGQRTTSKFQRDFDEYRKSQKNMAFTVENVQEMLLLFFGNYDQIMLDSLVEVFDKATSYHEENKIHTEGWKTNKGYKLNKKIIWPRGVTYDDKYFSKFDCYYSQDFLDDIDRILCWLVGKKPEELRWSTHTALRNQCRGANDGKLCYSDKFYSDFFEMRMFKKGTLHLVFRDLKLLEDFNRKAAQGKKWIGGDGF